MAITLTAKERDKAVLALRDIQGVLQFTRKAEFSDLTEIQVLLEARGLQIAPTTIERPLALTPVAAAPAPAARPAPAGPTLTTNELGWVETVVAMYKQNRANNRTGYVLTMEQLGRLLGFTCRLAKIPFKP